MRQIILGEDMRTPSKIICIGRNYVAHIKELNNEMPDDMVVFLKPNSAISEQLAAHHLQDEIHFEAELCFLFQDNALTAVAFGLDLTKRDLQSKLKVKGLPWERCKAFDGSVLFGPFTKIDAISNELNFQLEIDGQTIQSGNIDLMIYKPVIILAELQKFITLTDGDIIMTGTPKGVGVIKTGQVFTGKVNDGDQILSTCSWQAT